MENKQTAVEWLKSQFQYTDKKLFDQALELEKQQIIDAANIPKEQRWYEDKYNSCGEQYYFETYKSKQL